jgi:uncharacterized protein (DUF58 family)
MRVSIDAEAILVAGGLGLAGVGWAEHLTLLALVGTLVAVTAVVLWVWQRQCLTGVSYHRGLGQRRATFGEEVALELEFVNDKLLPLTWLHVEDEVPAGLTIRGGGFRRGMAGRQDELHHLLPMLPFQRVRRRLTVVCDQRGQLRFGPARVHTGDPVGLHQHQARVGDIVELLVYPKLFRLPTPPIVSRVPWGDQRAAPEVAGDPSRAAGVREYRPGDALRHVDWRATARSNALLIREFEPSATWRMAVFADIRVPRRGQTPGSADVAEFLIAVTASVVADVAGRGVATGLYTSGTVRGHPVARPPSTAPGALPAMLESLALVSPYGRTSIGELLLSEGGHLGGAASVVVLATDYPQQTVAALATVRRRLPVTAIWVRALDGHPPPRGTADVVREVTYRDDWRTVDVLEFAA